MLGRFQSSKAGTTAPDDPSPTYGESVLDDALELLASNPDGRELQEIVSAISEAVVQVEELAGTSNFPAQDTPARESFARTYATLIIDNDRQPPHLQMSGDDLARPQRLLASFFTGAPTMTADAQAVLRFIEERFARGSFSQARILLQLFETDAATRRSNERNIFYEEMMTRLQSRRTEPVAAPDPGDSDSGTGELDFEDAAEALESTFGIRLHTYGHDLDRDAAWTEALDHFPPSARDAALDLIPGPRWRKHWQTTDPLEAIAETFSHRGLRTFVTNLTRAAYFVTLSPGTTGFEDLIFRYVEWVSDHFETISTRILPRVHKESTLGELGIGEAIDTIWDEVLVHSPFVQREYEAHDLEEAFANTVARLNAEPPVTVPSGDYDLAGLVAFELFGFDPGSLDRALRLTRMT